MIMKSEGYKESQRASLQTCSSPDKGTLDPLASKQHVFPALLQAIIIIHQCDTKK